TVPLAGSVSTEVSTNGATGPTHDRRQYLALVGGNSTRCSMSRSALARRLAMGAAPATARQSSRLSLASTFMRPANSGPSAGHSTRSAATGASTARPSTRYVLVRPDGAAGSPACTLMAFWPDSIVTLSAFRVALESSFSGNSASDAAAWVSVSGAGRSMANGT